MRRKRASKRGRALLILVAGTAGYLLGGWHIVALHSSTDLSPSQTVALRFPDDAEVTATTPDAAASPAATASVTGAVKAMILGPAELALFSPEPLVPAPSQARQSAAQAEPAAAEAAAASQPAETAVAPHPRAAAVLRAIAPVRQAAAAAIAAVTHRAEQPGFLNDAQIASIKGRLHLTADQQRMWPAVEAALRNIAYANARDARRRGLPPGATDAAAIDPNGAEVANLKSAAIPLIMSFDDEQRNQVRSLAHVMGLDRLASEF